MYGCESWTIKKTECWGIDAFELWCWRRLLRVPWTARRSNQSILKEISPEYSLEGLMLKLKLQYFGYLTWRTDSFEKILMLGKFEGGRRMGQQRMRWWMASPTQWTWVWVNSGSWWWTGLPGVLQSMGSQRVGHNWATELTDWVRMKTPENVSTTSKSGVNSWPLTKHFTWFGECVYVCSVASVMLNTLRCYGLKSTTPLFILLQARILEGHSLLQGIFLIQGLNPYLLHCRQIFYSLSHQGSPNYSIEGSNKLVTKTPNSVSKVKISLTYILEPEGCHTLLQGFGEWLMTKFILLLKVVGKSAQ